MLRAGLGVVFSVWLLTGCGSSDEDGGAPGGGAGVGGTAAGGTNSGGTAGVGGGGAAGSGGGSGAAAGSGGGSAGDGNFAHSECSPGSSPSAGPHAYYDTLRARPECHAALSLRDAKQLQTGENGGYANCNKCPLDVTYDPAADSYPQKQDAAKIVVPADKNSLPNQVFLPIYAEHGERVLVSWDAWFGEEFAFSHHGIPNYKMWQLSSYNESIWCEVRARWALGFNQGNGALALVDGRTYSGVVGPNVTSKQPLEPQIGAFALWPERWVRYWALFEPQGEYDAYSLWVADEQTDPVQLFDQIQLQYRSDKAGTAVPRLGIFRIEFNTSHNTLASNRGPLTAYARNYVVLKGDMDVPSLLARPGQN